MASQFASHGRGGAGNMANSADSPKIDPADLETPSLKKPVVTTGRGGTGNMAKNKDPVETRLRQDVAPVARRPSSGAQIAGRGGAGNVFKGEDAEAARAASKENAIEDSPLPPSTSSTNSGSSSDTPAAKASSKSWFFGRKN